jgi:hypothetical protein
VLHTEDRFVNGWLVWLVAGVFSLVAGWMELLLVAVAGM